MATPEKTPSKDELLELRVDAIKEKNPEFAALADHFEGVVTQYMLITRGLSEILVKWGFERRDIARVIDTMVKKPAGIKLDPFSSCRVYAKLRYRGVRYHKRIDEG